MNDTQTNYPLPYDFVNDKPKKKRLVLRIILILFAVVLLFQMSFAILTWIIVEESISKDSDYSESKYQSVVSENIYSGMNVFRGLGVRAEDGDDIKESHSFLYFFPVINDSRHVTVHYMYSCESYSEGTFGKDIHSGSWRIPCTVTWERQGFANWTIVARHEHP